MIRASKNSSPRPRRKRPTNNAMRWAPANFLVERGSATQSCSVPVPLGWKCGLLGEEESRCGYRRVKIFAVLRGSATSVRLFCQPADLEHRLQVDAAGGVALRCSQRRADKMSVIRHRHHHTCVPRLLLSAPNLMDVPYYGVARSKTPFPLLRVAKRSTCPRSLIIPPVPAGYGKKGANPR